MQYIHVQPSPRTIQFSIRPGMIRPLARSGLGWMLLSARSDETIEKLVRRINFEEEDRKKKVDLKESTELTETAASERGADLYGWRTAVGRAAPGPRYLPDL